ncbi:hypothetical protein [Ruminiclostridium josui]|uniref:hypothetical protein n=1 Tax=Ruminiclostridium josui TaxID=1499 RepID=UPI0004ACABFD|nr:hypothetical protein [Ruminiclostridium josui]
MELNLIDKNGKTYTRFKIGNKELTTLPKKWVVALGQPSKKSSRFTYFEAEGDL